jgi:hypothetical protein
VNGLLARYPEVADVGDPASRDRYRLDRDTSGLMVVAPHHAAYEGLVELSPEGVGDGAWRSHGALRLPPGVIDAIGRRSPPRGWRCGGRPRTHYEVGSVSARTCRSRLPPRARTPTVGCLRAVGHPSWAIHLGGSARPCPSTVPSSAGASPSCTRSPGVPVKSPSPSPSSWPSRPLEPVSRRP